MTAEQVTASESDPLTLAGFAGHATAHLQRTTTFAEATRLVDEFRDTEGDWNDGSTCLVLLTCSGGVNAHALNREPEDEDGGIIPPNCGHSRGVVTDRFSGKALRDGRKSLSPPLRPPRGILKKRSSHVIVRPRLKNSEAHRGELKK